ncbi:MAG TPA: alpha/beta fold hydrolase [Syntrophomonadaceae bacterium]|nr:alpha/beta fold hydrolase [Syntrophomonadaceae bacterium]
MQKHVITSSAGKKLALISKMPAGKPNFVVIACHGFMGGKENRGWINILADKLGPLNFGLVAFDFAGSGESEGEFARITLTRQSKDLKDVITYVSKNYKAPLILLGRSFGGSTILAGGNLLDEVVGYILWATPVFLRETFSTIMPNEYSKMLQGHTVTIVEEGQEITIAPDFAIDLEKHNMDQYLLNIGKKPIMVIHGDADIVVSPANAKYIKEKLPHAQVHVVEGADHSFAGHEMHRIELTVEWLKKVFC